MQTTLDPETIEAVHLHLQKDGVRATVKEVNSITGGTTKEEAKAYLDAVVEKYPDDYKKEAPAAETTTPITAHGPLDLGTPQTFSLLNDKGILQPLSVVKSSNNKVILKFDEPTDIVKIFFRGSIVDVDLYQIRKTGISPLEGLSAQSVLVMGEAARAV